jgi:hypothetical protein
MYGGINFGTGRRCALPVEGFLNANLDAERILELGMKHYEHFDDPLPVYYY